MDQRAAITSTINTLTSFDDAIPTEHMRLLYTMSRVGVDTSPAHQGRILGFLQGYLYAKGLVTGRELKEMNNNHKGENAYLHYGSSGFDESCVPGRTDGDAVTTGVTDDEDDTE